MAQQQGQQADGGHGWGEIVADAWADLAFKERLLAQPAAVLGEYGIAVAAGSDPKLLDSSDRMPSWTVMLPTGPSQPA